LAIYIIVVMVVVAGIVLFAGLLREPSRDGFGVYESGAAPGPQMRGRLDAPYFLVAVFFMIFDVEVVLLFAWAVVATELGRAGLVAAAVFIAVLLAALAYLWMEGALDTGPKSRVPGP
jgi:NADH-quinone oxidoreductase subunit A